MAAPREEATPDDGVPPRNCTVVTMVDGVTSDRPKLTV